MFEIDSVNCVFNKTDDVIKRMQENIDYFLTCSDDNIRYDISSKFPPNRGSVLFSEVFDSALLLAPCGEKKYFLVRYLTSLNGKDAISISVNFRDDVLFSVRLKIRYGVMSVNAQSYPFDEFYDSISRTEDDFFSRVASGKDYSLSDSKKQLLYSSLMNEICVSLSSELLIWGDKVFNKELDYDLLLQKFHPAKDSYSARKDSVEKVLNSNSD